MSFVISRDDITQSFSAVSLLGRGKERILLTGVIARAREEYRKSVYTFVTYSFGLNLV